MAQLGQTGWNSQALGNGATGDGTNNFPVQAVLEYQLYREVRDAGVFGDMAIEKTMDTQTNGMFDAGTDVAGSGAVWLNTQPNGDERRFSMLRNITGAPTWGDAPPAEGDFQAYLFQNVYLNEVDSPKIPIPGRMSQQKVRALIADFKGPARQAIVNWHIEQRDFDAHAALIEGADYGIFLSPSTYAGAAGKDLGPGVGVGAPNENYYTGLLGQTKITVPSQGPRSTNYRSNVITALANLATDNTKFFSRVSPRVMYQLAVQNKIRKIVGKDWDFECIIDGACLNGIASIDGSLENRFALAQQGNGLGGQRSLDIRGNLILDGIRFIPSRTLEKFRPDCSTNATGLLNGTPALTYGDGTLDRRNKVFVGSTYKIGFAILLGQGGLLELNNKAVSTVEAQDADEKAWSVYGYTQRGFKRGFWQRFDGEAMNATDGWLNQNSIQFAFNINTSGALV